MWIFHSGGFISVVAHNEKPDTLLVRARDEGSLLSLVEATGATLRHTPHADYPCRIELAKRAFIEWFAEEVSILDYTNYKAHMWTERPDFSAALHEVWATMQSVEEPRVTQEDRDRAAKIYPNQKWTDEDIEMLKALGHI